MNLGLLGLFGVGVAIGLKSEKWLPPLQQKVKAKLEPVGKAGLSWAVSLADKAKDAFWERKERLADVVAEIREEQEETKTAKAPRYDA